MVETVQPKPFRWGNQASAMATAPEGRFQKLMDFLTTTNDFSAAGNTSLPDVRSPRQIAGAQIPPRQPSAGFKTGEMIVRSPAAIAAQGIAGQREYYNSRLQPARTLAKQAADAQQAQQDKMMQTLLTAAAQMPRAQFVDYMQAQPTPKPVDPLDQVRAMQFSLAQENAAALADPVQRRSALWDALMQIGSPSYIPMPQGTGE